MQGYSYKKQKVILIPLGSFIKNVPRTIVRGYSKINVIQTRIILIPVYVVHLGQIKILTYEGKESIEELFKDKIPYVANIELHKDGTGHLGPGPIGLSKPDLPSYELLSHKLLYTTLPNTGIELQGKMKVFTSPAEIRIIYGSNNIQKIIPTVMFFKPEKYRGKKTVKLFNVPLNLDAYEGFIYIYDKSTKKIRKILQTNMYSMVKLRENDVYRVIALICECEQCKGYRRQSVLMLEKALSNVSLISILVTGKLRNVSCEIKLSRLRFNLSFHIIKTDFRQRVRFLKSLLHTNDYQFIHTLKEYLELMDYVSSSSILRKSMFSELVKDMLKYDIILSPSTTLGFLKLTYSKGGNHGLVEYILTNSLNKNSINLNNVSTLEELIRVFNTLEHKEWDNQWFKMYSKLKSKRFIVL